MGFRTREFDGNVHMEGVGSVEELPAKERTKLERGTVGGRCVRACVGWAGLGLGLGWVGRRVGEMEWGVRRMQTGAPGGYWDDRGLPGAGR